MAPLEKGDAELLFKGHHLPADRRLRQEKLVCSGGEAQMARGRLKPPQKVQRREVSAHLAFLWRMLGIQKHRLYKACSIAIIVAD